MANTEWAYEPKNIHPSTEEDYLKLSEEIPVLGGVTPYYAFDLVENQFQRKPNGKVWNRDFITCSPSAEILAFQKIGGQWHLCLGLQSRSVLRTVVNGEIHSQLLLEQFAGCLDKGEHYIDAAIRELREESGYQACYLAALTANVVTRHVGRAPEPSMFFWAILEESPEAQQLDENEIIARRSYPLDEVRTHYINYLHGKETFFFGYEMPVETQFALSTFFFLEAIGEIDLENPDWGKNLLGAD